MTPTEHYRRAESLAREAADRERDLSQARQENPTASTAVEEGNIARLIARAQVHATLAAARSY